MRVADGLWVLGARSSDRGLGFIFRLTANGVPTHGLYAHYDIGHELGKGSFASVRVAVSRSNGKKYAVKMIHDKASTRANGTGTRQATLTREINIMEKLKHRNICELVEVFFHENNEISVYPRPLSLH